MLRIKLKDNIVNNCDCVARDLISTGIQRCFLIANPTSRYA